MGKINGSGPPCCIQCCAAMHVSGSDEMGLVEPKFEVLLKLCPHAADVWSLTPLVNLPSFR